MKCRYCDADTRVLSTRERDQFLFVRRRACEGPEEHRFNTVEILQAYLHKLAKPDRIQRVMQHFNGGVAARRLAQERRKQVADLRAQGHKQDYIASALGISRTRVQEICAELRAGAPGKIGRPPKDPNAPTEFYVVGQAKGAKAYYCGWWRQNKEPLLARNPGLGAKVMTKDGAKRVCARLSDPSVWGGDWSLEPKPRDVP